MSARALPGLPLLRWVAVVVALVIAITPGSEASAQDNPTDIAALRAASTDAEAHRLAQPITLAAHITDPTGTPIGGAVFSVGDRTATTSSDGALKLSDAPRTRSIATLEAEGWFSRVVPVHADRPVGVNLVDLGTITLVPRTPTRQSLVFAGDVSLGRRYHDPDGTTARDALPEPHPDALIRRDTALDDTTAVLRHLAPLLRTRDLASVNLETVVTDTPVDPQDWQLYVFYTLPDSLMALADAGVDYVSLGNNHAGDYGAQGITDTLEHVGRLGLAHSGTGLSADEAFDPALIDGGNAGSLAMHSWVATRPTASSYHATEERAGAASANDFERMGDALTATEATGHFSIAHVHTGYEYSNRPPDQDPNQLVQRRLRFAADEGADLVVGHHPHSAQGFERRDGVLIAHSLGNAAFDQNRLDTLHGAMLGVVTDGDAIVDTTVEPLFISDYVPMAAVGEPADLLLRRLSSVSDDDLVIIAEGGTGTLLDRAAARLESRTVEVRLQPGVDGTAMVDLRTLRLPHESFAAVQGLTTEKLSLGRDLMVFGGMEDDDLDDVPGETTAWNFGTASWHCGDMAHRGVGAICSSRQPHHEDPSAIWFGQRIRLDGTPVNEPNRDVTFLFWERAMTRGDVEVSVEWLASLGAKSFGREVVANLPARDGEWAPRWIDLDVPADDPALVFEVPDDKPYGGDVLMETPRAVKLRLEHTSAPGTESLLIVDDAALISWQTPTVIDGRVETPNPFDFVRISDAQPGQTITITFDRYFRH